MKAMYLCQYHKMEKESEFAVAFLVIVLCSLSAYFISDFAGNTQLRILSGKECLGAYKILFQVNKVTSLFVPIVICAFISTTTHILLSDFFEEKIKFAHIFSIVGIAMIPILLDNYFFWINLISYAANSSIRTINDFMNIRYYGNLTITNFETINTICWILVYMIIITRLYALKIKFYKAAVATILPTLVLIITYYSITFLI